MLFNKMIAPYYENDAKYINKFYICVSVHHKSIICNKPTRYNSGSIVFIDNYNYALHVSDAKSDRNM